MRRNGQILESEIDFERAGVLVWSRSKFPHGRRFDRYDWHGVIIFSRKKFERVAEELGNHSEWFYEIISIPIKLKSDVVKKDTGNQL